MGSVSVAIYLVVCGYALCEEAQKLRGDVVNFAAGIDTLFVLTDTWLQQMRFDPSPETVKEMSTTGKLQTLLPFTSNGTMIICGSNDCRTCDDCGYCEVLDIGDISVTKHKESITIGLYPSLAFIVGHGGNKYILVAKNGENSKCESDALVTLRNTRDDMLGGIFSKRDVEPMAGTASIQHFAGTEVKFVDGFQINVTASSHIYLLLNEKRKSELKVKLLTMNIEATKIKTFQSLTGASLQCCEGGQSWTLLSSALIRGQSPVLWAGVFQRANQSDTAVAIFDISPEHTAAVSGFCTNKDACESTEV